MGRIITIADVDRSVKHRGSQDLIDLLTQWEDCSIPFSKTFKWEHWGVFGVLSDFVLNYIKGDIIEIGVVESSVFLTKLALKYNRTVYHCDFEAGKIINSWTVDGYFDPVCSITFNGSSDEFFDYFKFPPIALGFIDGDHNYEQVKKDFDNLFLLLVDDGYIFLHDTYPISEEYCYDYKCGTVYKLRQELEQRNDIDCFTFTKSAFDVGLTMVRKKPKNLEYFKE